MDRTTLTKLLDVHWADIHAADPEAIGAITIVLHRTANDNLSSHMAANVPADIVRYALATLVAEWAIGGGPQIETCRPARLRKAT